MTEIKPKIYGARDTVTTGRPASVLEQRLGASWPALDAAERRSEATVQELETLMADAATSDVAVVVFGSIARREVTSGSDVDWTLLIDGLSDPAHHETARELEHRLADANIKAPGQEGTFGGLAFSHTIIHQIGGEDDSNRNTTQRALLLLESVALGTDDAYRRVIRNVLTRYITEDWGWVNGRGPAKVPRFLQNDLARYWRTVAVDFAYKRRARGAKGWALRTAKLRMSRKVTYAAGLLACFSLDLEASVLGNASTGDTPPQKAVAHLEERFALCPLDIIATTVLDLPELHDPARKLFGAYDRFLTLLNDDNTREHLDLRNLSTPMRRMVAVN